MSDGLDLQFQDQSSGDPTAWSWSFGDGTTSSAQHPAKSYAAAGNYSVSLTAYNATSSDTATQTITVSTVDDVVASFTFVANGLDLQFQDTSAGNPTTWAWDFGDVSTSAAQHPSHSYAAAGDYVLELTVTNATSSDTVSQLISVSTVNDVVASFNFTADPSDGLMITFQDTSTGSPT